MIRGQHQHTPHQAIDFSAIKNTLLTRRQLLLGMAGGSLALLLPVKAQATDVDRWATLDTVLLHLFPEEPNAPGAHSIQALRFLKNMHQDPLLAQEDRAFILQGAGWLEDMSQRLEGRAFTKLDTDTKEQVLLKIAASDAGENWLSTLIVHLLEALLTDPVYGGNPNGIGWKWLGHIAGFPRPDAGHTYLQLLEGVRR